MTVLVNCALMIHAASAQATTAPDLDHLISMTKAPYPLVDSLDRVAYRVTYYDQNKPSPAEREKLIELYKLLSKGYATVFHFRQGYEEFNRYLSLKEQKLLTQKADTMHRINENFRQVDSKDEAEVSDLRNKADDLDQSISSLTSRGSWFKKIVSGIIAVLSLMFAVSLFRTGVRIKEINTSVLANRQKLLDNHRLSVLGILSNSLHESLEENEQKLKSYSKDLRQSIQGDSEEVKSVRAKLQELENM
jgi:hypothetical protein